MSKVNDKAIRTYMAFGLPVDPANVRTLVDLDLSYALAATLVEWSSARQIVAGLAESWEIIGENEIAFKVRKNLKWSNGESVLAPQVVASLVRAKKVHGDSLKSLFDMVLAIKAVGDDKILFTLKVKAATSGILNKLTEPMYGVLRLTDTGSIDLGTTVGPFTMVASSADELKLAVNRKWFGYDPKMADEVTIRRPAKGEELQASFLKDSWVNLMTSSSLVEEATHAKYKQQQYAIWNRNLDKIFFLSPSLKMTNKDGRELFQFLSQNLNRAALTKGMSGFSLSDQFFPSGYILFDPEFTKQKFTGEAPKKFKQTPITILGADSRLSNTVQASIKGEIKRLTGIEPKFKLVSLSEFEKTRGAGDYDFVAAALPVNDPNVEGAMGFFFGLTPPIIPDAGDGRLAFSKRIAEAKKLDTQNLKNAEYRKVFSDATNAGSILPLFHYSTVVIAKEGMDLSQVPMSDETVAFSKVRFK